MINSVPVKEIVFQVMTEADLDDILAIENVSHTHPWSIGIFQDCLRVGYYSPMLKSGEEIIAYGVMSIAVEEAHIFNVCVSSEYRGKGFGLQMMEHLLKVAKEKSAKSVFLEVRPSNEVAIQLYNKIGFLEVGIRKDYYPAKKGREDALIFAMDIFLE